MLWLPASASAADGGISGKVTLAEGGGPVEKATVCAETEGEVLDFECTETAADGSYEITGLTPADYLVFFEAGESGRYLIGQYYDGVRSWFEADDVTVNSAATTPGIDAALAEGGAIAGEVTDSVSGVPVREVLVCSALEAGAEGETCTETGNDGSYELVGVPAGLNAVEFLPFEGDYDAQVIGGVAVSVGVRKPNVNAALVHVVPAQGRISGHVRAAATQAPLQGISVCAIWVKTGKTGGCAITSPLGAYGFFPVPPGALKIVFSPEPAEVEFRPGVQSDIWPTQFWKAKPTFAEADALDVTPTSNFTGIDGLLGPGPEQPTSEGPSTAPGATAPAPAPAAVAPKAKSLTCRKGFVKKRLKGKVRCVERHHRRHHHHKRHHPHR